MNSQKRIFNCVFLITFVTIFCMFWLPIINARNMESSKNELRGNDIAESSSSSGKINSPYNNGPSSSYYSAKHNLRSMLMSPKDYQLKVHSKVPLNMDLMDFLLEYEDEDRSKRFDDYGHMRFGKRGGEEQFDDYGHMRFGRGV